MPVNAEPSVRPKIDRSTTEPMRTANSSVGSRLERAAVAAGLPVVLGRRQRLAFDELHHLVEAGVDAAVEVALAEGGRDGLGNDALRDGIGQHALEAVADLDPQVAIVLGNDQQRAVIHLLPIDRLAAELPRVRDPERVLLDVLGLGGRHDQHRELRALGGLERRELLLERRLLLRGQRAGEIGDARGQLRDRLQAARGRRDLRGCREAHSQQPAAARSASGRGAAGPGHHCVAGCPGGGVRGVAGVLVSKLTVGAVEICCSLATVKFGFTWKPNILAVRLTGKERTVTL